ncbi:MAG: antibiotic biosynthesis monooxygenase [Rhodocyclaceae bacterium]|nr:antibiotic biosynthesis monooxygenase [Rhodocyclaceae bacterium]
MPQLVVTARITAKPDCADALEQAMRVLVEATRREAGCLAYELYRHTELPEQFLFHEQWADRAALEAHWQAEHMHAYRRVAGPLIAARDVQVLQPEVR